jgi:DNA-binding CsgD family transcriptional regulator
MAMARDRQLAARELSEADTDSRVGPSRAEVYYRSPTGSMLDRPTFVLNSDGAILFANPPGQKFLKQTATEVQRSLAAVVRSGWTDLPWDLTCLDGSGQAKVFVAILQSPLPDAPTASAVEAAALRWKLTSRQRQVLDLVTRGLTNVDTAGLLGITESTVEYHLSAVFDKAGVDNRATLIVRLQQLSD